MQHEIRSYEEGNSLYQCNAQMMPVTPVENEPLEPGTPSMNMPVEAKEQPHQRQEYYTDSGISDEEPVIFGGQADDNVMMISAENGSESSGQNQHKQDMFYQGTENVENPNHDALVRPYKICTWNVAGLRSVIRKENLEFFKMEKPDIIAIQEIKFPEKKLPEKIYLPGYSCYFEHGEIAGYSGVVTLTKEQPIEVIYGLGNEEFDRDGRVLTLEFDKFYVVNAYVPTSGEELASLDK